MSLRNRHRLAANLAVLLEIEYGKRRRVDKHMR